MPPLNLSIIWPTLALVLLIFSVWSILLRQRFAHIVANRPTVATFANGRTVARYFEPVERPAHNLANLFEMPILYFALVPLLLLTGHVSGLQVSLAWVFVAFRLAHSIVHIGPNAVRIRARVYIVSNIVLFAMWIGFAMDIMMHAGGRI